MYRYQNRRGTQVVKPNNFEQAILDAAWKAQKFHDDMTDGLYLGYSHESFLQNFIAIEVFKNKKKAGHYVFVDASPKKIREWAVPASKKPPKYRRFDLVFWFKSKNEVKAIVEIKRAWEKSSVMGDVNKLRKYRDTKDGQNIRDYYVLYYTSHSVTDKRKGEGRELIEGRFSEVDKEIKKGTRQNKQSVGLRHGPYDYIHPDKDDPWGFALFRC